MAGLYVHVPFCETKCIYCNFYSVEHRRDFSGFVDLLLSEIRLLGESSNSDGTDVPDSFDTLFFGGGTPSLLDPSQIGSIITALDDQFGIDPDAEITMECNPGALRRDWLTGYRSHGVNRLSFGVQSFHDDDLAFLSRIHTAAEAEENIRLVRSIFENLSLDLIFALPNQTLDRWRYNLERAIDLGTDHVSAYALIFEEGTPLNRMRLQGRVAPAMHDDEADMYELTVDLLASAGLLQYEVSNYAKPGAESRHNLAYWTRQPYLSVGPSAHSFSIRGGSPVRWANVSSLSAWERELQGGRLPIISREVLTDEQLLEETLLLGLRGPGVDLSYLRERLDFELSVAAPRTWARVIENDLGSIQADRLILNPAGRMFADRLALEFWMEGEPDSAARIS